MTKKILYSSNFSLARTGFGKHSRVFLSWLYNRKNPDGSKKYEIVEFAQGTLDNDPKIKGLPWKVIGAVPSDERAYDKYRVNGLVPDNVRKMINYGAETVDKILKEEKPSVTIFCEDPWAFQSAIFGPFWNAPWFNKSNTALWFPSDSLPQQKDISDNIGKIKHAWVKSTFASKDYHKQGHEHVKCFPFLLDVKDHRPFSQEEKKSLREKYNIPQNSVNFGFVFRNQGRKRIFSLINGFKIFIDRNPEQETRLILLTNIHEGWNIRRLVKEAGVPEEKVLYVNLCRECNDVTYQPNFGENETDCQKCGTKGAVTTPNIFNGITEKELVETYNLMDGYVSVANSGGFEGGCGEALFCGVPLACPNYSYGEMFCDSGFVHHLDFTFDVEMESLFKKAVIYDESVAEFMQKIKDDPEGMREIGLKGAEWANNTLHPDKILPEIEKIIDEMPEHNYSFDYSLDYPNPDAEFPNIEDEDEFIIEMIFRFFGYTVDQNHQDFKVIKHHLANGITREQAFQESVRVARNKKKVLPDLKSFFKNTPPNKKIVLYEMPGDYGDSLLSLAPLESLRALYPAEEWDIYVSCHPQYVEVYEHLDFIAGFVPFIRIDDPHVWEGSRYQEKLVDVFISPSRDQNYKHNGAAKTEFHLDKTPVIG